MSDENKLNSSASNELLIEARTDNLNLVLDFIHDHLANVGCSPKAMMQIDLAAEEIFVNIAHYAYNPELGHALVKVEFEENPVTIVITFMDNGTPYDPLKREDPDITLSAEERQIGGLGIFLTKKTMDEVSYEFKDNKNILKLKKKLSE